MLCVLFVRTPPQLPASEPKPERQSRQALRTSSVWAISLSTKADVFGGNRSIQIQ